MAKKCVLGVNQTVVDKLMGMRWLVDVEFWGQETLDKAISLGFEVDVWEEKNNNKALVKKNEP